MSIARIALWTFVALIVSAVAGYILVSVGFFSVWQILGIRDRDGGGAMAVGFVFAPIGAVVIGLIGAIVAFARLWPKRAAGPKPDAAAGDDRLFLRVACAIAGFVLGFMAVNPVRALLSGLVHALLPAAIAFAAMPFVLPPLFAVIGFYLARKLNRPRAS